MALENLGLYMLHSNEDEDDTNETDPYQDLNNRLFVIQTYFNESVGLIQVYDRNLVKQIDSIKSLVEDVLENAKKVMIIIINPGSINKNDKEDVVEAIELLVQDLNPKGIIK